VNRGIPDVRIDFTGRQIEVAIPRDAFAHSRNDAIISLTVLQSDGTPLPSWLTFDPRLGVLRGVPPEGTHADIEVRVIARDQNGNQVEVTFRIKIQAGTTRVGKDGLSQQLLAAGQWGRSLEQQRQLIELARANASHQKIAARG
jgi:hypothetical protein